VKTCLNFEDVLSERLPNYRSIITHPDLQMNTVCTVSVGSFFKKILFLNLKSAVATRPTLTTRKSLQILTHYVESSKLFSPFSDFRARLSSPGNI
jgi:hypothetical protein